MLVVSDTSPISNLAVIGQLLLLRERYGRVVIPPKVLEELNRLSHPEGSQEIENALSDGWLVVEPLPDETWLRKLEERVDPGEAAAICLAESIQADKLLVDDRQGARAGTGAWNQSCWAPWRTGTRKTTRAFDLRSIRDDQAADGSEILHS